MGVLLFLVVMHDKPLSVQKFGIPNVHSFMTIHTMTRCEHAQRYTCK
jgi:hypothetical protein